MGLLYPSIRKGCVSSFFDIDLPLFSLSIKEAISLWIENNPEEEFGEPFEEN